MALVRFSYQACVYNDIDVLDHYLDTFYINKKYNYFPNNSNSLSLVIYKTWQSNIFLAVCLGFQNFSWLNK